MSWIWWIWQNWNVVYYGEIMKIWAEERRSWWEFQWYVPSIGDMQKAEKSGRTVGRSGYWNHSYFLGGLTWFNGEHSDLLAVHPFIHSWIQIGLLMREQRQTFFTITVTKLLHACWGCSSSLPICRHVGNIRRFRNPTNYRKLSKYQKRSGYSFRIWKRFQYWKWPEKLIVILPQ
jgi:hypothetical protein